MKAKTYSPLVQRLGELTARKTLKTCDGCTACCSVMSVKEIGLDAYTRCPHLRSFPWQPGCGIYHQRPGSCRVWSCQYLIDGWDDDLRPDRCGVVVDPNADVITIGGKEVAAAQFWATKGYEDAWRTDPVQALVLAAIEAVHYVIWRWKSDDGQQMAMAILKNPETGQYGHTTPRVAAGYPGMTEGERLLRAKKLLPKDQR